MILFKRIAVFILIGFLGSFNAYAIKISLEDRQMATIAKKIYIRETGGNVERLLFWNPKEAFPSLGIGHFIWPPRGTDVPFEVVFPQFVSFLVEQRGNVPEWMRMPYCPWETRDAFYTAINANDPRMVELRNLISSTIPTQAAFIVYRFESELTLIEQALKKAKNKKALQQIQRMAQDPQGIYAMIDYLNFKGSGLSEKERYLGCGWGLMQVFEAMAVMPNSEQACADFSTSCIAVLAKRVRNAPDPEKEKCFLQGWVNRCKAYAEHG